MVMSASGNGNFDISKKTFDVLSLQSRRGDALLQYSSTNQSEPLRINLYALFAISFVGFPSISEAVLGEQLGLIPSILSVVVGGVSVGLFVRECSRRSRQIDRLEKEMNSEFLSLDVPNGVGGMLPTLQLKDLRGQRRVLAVSGNMQQISDALLTARVLKRRLLQASVAIVAVPTDGSKRKDWGLGADNGATWLCDAKNNEEWLKYFNDLVPNRKENDFAWFGLKFTGRSFGSGSGKDFPRFLELFGSFLQPRKMPDETAGSMRVSDGSDEESVLESQRLFYDALTNGKLQEMNDACLPSNSVEVTEVVDAGGRLDSWDNCLAEGARPSGMIISDADAVVISKDLAFSTCVEFPTVDDFDTATLLAIQEWRKSGTSNEWLLSVHQTIPWSIDSKAGGTLRCDCRGCVSLIRQSRRPKSFGFALVDT